MVVLARHKTSRGSVSFKIPRSLCWISTTSQNDVSLMRWCWHVALATVTNCTGLLTVLKSNSRHVTRPSYLDWEHRSCSRVSRSPTVEFAVRSSNNRHEDVFWFSGYKIKVTLSYILLSFIIIHGNINIMYVFEVICHIFYISWSFYICQTGSVIFMIINFVSEQNSGGTDRHNMCCFLRD